MLTGYCDSIARKAPLGSIEITPGMSRRKRLTGKNNSLLYLHLIMRCLNSSIFLLPILAYLSCDPAITTPIYIHPHSTLYSKA